MRAACKAERPVQVRARCVGKFERTCGNEEVTFAPKIQIAAADVDTPVHALDASRVALRTANFEHRRYERLSLVGRVFSRPVCGGRKIDV